MIHFVSRFGPKMLGLVLAAALFGCEPEEVDMDAEGVRPEGVPHTDDEMDMEDDLGAEDRPGTRAPDAAATPDLDRPTLEIPTQTPQPGSEEDAQVPEIDIAPQPGGATGGAGDEGGVAPEIDLTPGAAEGDASESGETSVPEVDPS